MLISTKHKFIFIHIPKTGGTSIREALLPVSDELVPLLNSEGQALIKRRIAGSLAVPPPHVTLGYASQILNFSLHDYFVVAVFRDPLERIISYYKYLCNINKSHRLSQTAMLLSLDQFVQKFLLDTGHDTRPQSDYISQDLGAPKQKFIILRQHRLGKDYNQMMDMFNLPRIRLPNLNASGKQSYIKISSSNRQLVLRYEDQMKEFLKKNYLGATHSV